MLTKVLNRIFEPVFISISLASCNGQCPIVTLQESIKKTEQKTYQSVGLLKHDARERPNMNKAHGQALALMFENYQVKQISFCNWKTAS